MTDVRSFQGKFHCTETWISHFKKFYLKILKPCTGLIFDFFSPRRLSLRKLIQAFKEIADCLFFVLVGDIFDTT